MLAIGAGGAEALAALHFAVDQQVAGLHRHLRPHRESIALDTAQINLQPVILVALEVAIESVVRVIAGIMTAELSEDIQAAVFVEIHERDAVTLVAGAREADVIGQIGKRAVAIVAEKAIGLEPADL